MKKYKKATLVVISIDEEVVLSSGESATSPEPSTFSG